MREVIGDRPTHDQHPRALFLFHLSPYQRVRRHMEQKQWSIRRSFQREQGGEEIGGFLSLLKGRNIFKTRQQRKEHFKTPVQHGGSRADGRESQKMEERERCANCVLLVVL
eukprot:506983-Hanusia_phi.AAC.1